jgi:hypothetical protein
MHLAIIQVMEIGFRQAQGLDTLTSAPAQRPPVQVHCHVRNQRILTSTLIFSHQIEYQDYAHLLSE